MAEDETTSKQGTRDELAVRSNLLIPAAIVVAGVVIAFAIIYTSGGRPTSLKTAGVPPPVNSKVAAGSSALSPAQLADDDPVLGDPNAPVTLVEFSDFQCPFCRGLWRDALPQIKEKYIKTGKVKFVYRDFPLTSIHGLAQKYAEAGECADAEGRFWQMHDKIFEEQDKKGAGTIFDYTVMDLKRWAREIGLEGPRFDACLDSGKYRDEVQKDFNDGQAAGVSGTPGTFINGRLVVGALPFEQFQSLIDAALAGK